MIIYPRAVVVRKIFCKNLNHYIELHIFLSILPYFYWIDIIESSIVFLHNFILFSHDFIIFLHYLPGGAIRYSSGWQFIFGFFWPPFFPQKKLKKKGQQGRKRRIKGRIKGRIKEGTIECVNRRIWQRSKKQFRGTFR